MRCIHCNGKIKTSTLFYRYDETFISISGDACSKCNTPDLTQNQKKELNLAVNDLTKDIDTESFTIEYIGALDD